MLQIVVYHGNREMRVGCGIAMARKVLCSGHHPVRACAPNIRGDQIAYLLSVATECPRPNDRVGGIRVHIRYREQVPMHAESTAFLSRNATELLGVFQIARGPKCHRMRKDSSSKEMGWKDTSLKISSDQQWEGRFLL